MDLTSQWALLPCLAPANNCCFCSLHRETRTSLAVASLSVSFILGASVHTLLPDLTHCEICVHAFCNELVL